MEEKLKPWLPKKKEIANAKKTPYSIVSRLSTNGLKIPHSKLITSFER